MIKIIIIGICVILKVNLVICQVLQYGKCGEVATMAYFDLERFVGQWYEIERFPTWYEDYGQCAYKDIQVCGRRVEIKHYYVIDHIQYVLHVNSTYKPGDEAVFVIQENNIDPIGIPLSVITTDYSNYAVIYGCKYNENFGIRYLSAWILSREATLSPLLRERARIEVNSLPYASVAYLEPVLQGSSSCEFQWTAHVQSVNIEDEYTD